MIAAKKVAAQLGGKRVLGRRVLTDADLDRLVREGIPVEAAEFLVAEKALSPGELYEVVAPRTTLNRRSREGARTLSPDESDRAARIARVVATAEEVFADRDAAHAWLRAPNPGLGGTAPLVTCRTEVGTRRVEALLFEIAHGLPA